MPNFDYLLRAIKYPFSGYASLKVHSKTKNFEYLSFRKNNKQYNIVQSQAGVDYIQDANCIVFTASLCDYFQPDRSN